MTARTRRTLAYTILVAALMGVSALVASFAGLAWMLILPAAVVATLAVVWAAGEVG